MQSKKLILSVAVACALANVSALAADETLEKKHREAIVDGMEQIDSVVSDPQAYLRTEEELGRKTRLYGQLAELAKAQEAIRKAMGGTGGANPLAAPDGAVSSKTVVLDSTSVAPKAKPKPAPKPVVPVPQPMPMPMAPPMPRIDVDSEVRLMEVFGVGGNAQANILLKGRHTTVKVGDEIAKGYKVTAVDMNGIVITGPDDATTRLGFTPPPREPDPAAMMASPPGGFDSVGIRPPTF